MPSIESGVLKPSDMRGFAVSPKSTAMPQQSQSSTWTLIYLLKYIYIYIFISYIYNIYYIYIHMCSSIKVPNNNPSKKFGFLNRKVQSTRTVLLFLFRLLDLFISGVPTNSFIWLNEQMDTKPPPGSKPNK